MSTHHGSLVTPILTVAHSGTRDKESMYARELLGRSHYEHTSICMMLVPWD